jgi:hypothetical protein
MRLHIYVRANGVLERNPATGRASFSCRGTGGQVRKRTGDGFSEAFAYEEGTTILNGSKVFIKQMLKGTDG